MPLPRPRYAAALLALMLGSLIAYAGQPMFTNDAFWHVNTGAFLVHGQGFTPRDPFSFTTADQRWFHHEWLTQVLFWAVHACGGMVGLRLLTAGLATAVAMVCYRLYRRELKHPLWGVLGVLAFSMLGFSRLQTRPTLLTILALLLLVTLLTRRSTWRWRDGVATVILVLLWTNAHSVGLLAVPIYGAFLLGEAIKVVLQRKGAVAWPPIEPGHLRRHLVTFAGVVLATLCTPAGIDLYAFAFQDKSTVMQYVSDEWGAFSFVYGHNESLPLATYLGVLISTAVLALTYVGCGLVMQRQTDRLHSAALPDPGRVTLMLALFAGGLMARRFHWLHAVTLLLCLDTLLQMHRAGHLRWLVAALGQPAVRVAGVAGLFLATLALPAVVLRVEKRSLAAEILRGEYWTRGVSPSLELDGVQFLADSELRGNALCHYNSGGILSYHLHPAVKVFIDSRIDLYRRGVFLEYLAVRNGRLDQQEILDRYGTDIYYRHWSLVPPVDGAAWVPVFRGRDGEVYVRRGPGSAANLRRCEEYWGTRGVAFDLQEGLGVAAVPR